MGRIDSPTFDNLIPLPREKAESYGISSLSDSELLALILDTGTRSENVVELSSRLLKERGGLKSLLLSDEKNLYTCGIKKAKAYRIMAIREIINRYMMDDQEKIETSLQAYTYLKSLFIGIKSELLIVLYLNHDKTPLRIDKYTDNSPKKVSTPLNSIIKNALKCEARYVIIAHNHPSTVLTPSSFDKINAQILADKLLLIDALLLDSLIVSGDDFFSFRDEKVPPFE